MEATQPTNSITHHHPSFLKYESLASLTESVGSLDNFSSFGWLATTSSGDINFDLSILGNGVLLFITEDTLHWGVVTSGVLRTFRSITFRSIKSLIT